MARTATAKAAKPDAQQISRRSRARARPNNVAVAGEAAAVWVHPDKLQPWAANPRRNDHAVGPVAASIREFGFGAPIVARSANGEIIKGHTRWKAAQQLGLERVPVRYLDISEAKAHRLARADNKLGELSEWDDSLLAEQLAELESDELLLEGWGPDEVGDLLAQINGEDGEAEPSAAIFTREQLADAMMSCFYGRHPSDFASPLWKQMQEVNKLASGSRTHGYHVPDAYYRHRFDTLCGNAPESIASTFSNRDALRGGILLALEQDDDASSMLSVFSRIGRYHGRQEAGQFNPVVARDLYRKHCQPGARVLDPCAGWGGRLLGWFAAQLDGSYLGFDASRATVESAAAMRRALGIGNAIVEHAAFEDVELEPCAYDFALTSPPYFSQERYSQDAEQSIERYGTYVDWRAGFLVPLLRKTHDALRPGSAFVLNIDDVKQGSQTFPLTRDAVDAAIAAGFVMEEVYKHDFAQSGDDNGFAHGAVEPFLVLRKPER